MARSKQLSVRFDPETYGQLEAIAAAEHRPIANQVVHFVYQGIWKYAREREYGFSSIENGKVELEPWEETLSPEDIQRLRSAPDSR